MNHIQTNIFQCICLKLQGMSETDYRDTDKGKIPRFKSTYNTYICIMLHIKHKLLQDIAHCFRIKSPVTTEPIFPAHSDNRPGYNVTEIESTPC